MNASGPKCVEVVVRLKISASAEEIFDLWLDSKSPGSPWFGLKRAIVQPVQGGLFHHLVHFEGRDWPHYGRFIVLDRPRCIEHTWVSEATRGIETIVNLNLEAQGGQTLVTLRQSNIPDDEMGRGHEAGWGFVLGAIAERFAPRNRRGRDAPLE